jgi:hypothetical protein
MNLFRFCFLFILLWNAPSFATIDINKVEIINASRVVKPDNTQSNPNNGGTVTPSGNIKVFAGIAGDFPKGTCTSGITTTCSNCTGDNLPCNANRISPDSVLRFEFQTDNTSAITSSSALFLTFDTTGKITPENASTSLGVNSTLYIEVKWATLCAALGSPNCANPLDAVKTLQVGISSSSGDSTLEEYFPIDLYLVGSSAADLQYASRCPPGEALADSNAGYCWFEVERGDEKVYITQEAHIESFDTAPGGVVNRRETVRPDRASGRNLSGGG